MHDSHTLGFARGHSSKPPIWSINHAAYRIPTLIVL